MPTITISDESFKKLQALAEPFVDTPETVIATLAAAELQRRGSAQTVGITGTAARSYPVLDPDDHENLTHTRLLAATIDGDPMHRPKWNNVLDELHVIGRSRLGSFEALRKASGANLKDKKYEQNGYRYLPGADLSIQGVDANLAWQHSLKLARALKIPIEARFEWRDKEGAARPGETAILRWEP